MKRSYSIVHELNNCFGVIERLTSIISKEFSISNASEKPSDELEILRESVTRSKELLGDLRESILDFTRNELDFVSIPEWAQFLKEEVTTPLARCYGVEIDIVHMVRTDKKVCLNLRAAKSLCDNLIANAVASDCKNILIIIDESDHAFDLRIRDNGSGMAKHEILRLGLGFTSHGEGRGRGFGLVRKLASEMGAVVREPQSILGVGTEIVVSFMKLDQRQAG